MALATGGKSAKTLKVTQVKSTIGFDRKQELVIRGLGFRRLGQTIEVPDSAATRGMIHTVRHLVRVED